MKIDRLEAHDRLLYLKNDQRDVVSQGCEDCLKRNPLSLAMQQRSPYVYIFAHPRTADDGVTKRLLWQPRLTRPSPQTNSYLFRAQSNTDNLEICWMIPPTEMWDQYKKGNVTENEIVLWSIGQFNTNRRQLESDSRDLADHIVDDIYQQIAKDLRREKMMNKWLDFRGDPEILI